jgi:EmrB/QacA subfamily drug resistance transporter
MNNPITFPNFHHHRTVADGLVARQRWQWAVLGVVLVGATMSALDISIVNIALPTMKQEFGVRLSLIEWVSIAYMIVLAISLPIVGRLADIFGRSLLYNIGFGIFVIGSALCGLAPNAVVLILARALQAIGAGLLQANSVALITQVFRSRELGRALGIQAATQATAMALGPFIGAMLIALVGWRAIFYVNVPIGIVGGIAAHLVLPRYHATIRHPKIDYPGMVLFTAALVGVALALNTAEASGWWSPVILAEMLLGVVALAGFIMLERRVTSPTIDPSMFRHYRLIAGNITAFLAYYALFAVLFLLPFYFEQALGYSTLASGILLMPIPLSMAALAPFAGAACDRFGARNLTIAGSAMLAAGCAVLFFASPQREPVLLIIAMIILGSGLGIFTPANNRATMAATPRDKLGVMGGLLNMMRSLGLIFGIDISGMLFLVLADTVSGGSVGHNASSAMAFLTKPAFMMGFHGVLLSLTGVALLSTVLSYFRRHDSRGAPPLVPIEPIELM